MKTFGVTPYWHQGDYLATIEGIRLLCEKEEFHARLPLAVEWDYIGFSMIPGGEFTYDLPVFNFDVTIYRRKVDKSEVKRKTIAWAKGLTDEGYRVTKKDKVDKYQQLLDAALAEAPIKGTIVPVMINGSNFYVLSSSPATVDKVLGWLRSILHANGSNLPIVPVCTALPPWHDYYLHSVVLGMAPTQFTIGSGALLTDGTGSISVKNEDLSDQNITELARAGRFVTSLELSRETDAGDDTASWFTLDRWRNISKLKINALAATSGSAHASQLTAALATRYLVLAEVLEIYRTLNADLYAGDRGLREASGLEEEEVEV